MTEQSKIQNRIGDSTERVGESGQGHQVIEENQAAMPGLN